MIKIYYSAKLDNVYWKIYTDFINKDLFYFTSGSSVFDVANKVCQFSLFDLDQKEYTYVVDATEWKLKDTQTINVIKEIASINKTVIFVFEATAIKNKLFNDLRIECIKANNVNRKSKQQLVHLLLLKANITLTNEVEEYLLDLLPDKVNFIQNEIEKLKSIGQHSYTRNEIKDIIFDAGEVTIFNVIDSWLKNDMDKTIKGINDFLDSNYDVLEFIPIFTYKLMQLKFFFSAKKENWSTDTIATKLGIPPWQQIPYAQMKPYDKVLLKINNMITKLYNFDINIKKQKNVPYAQLIRILFE